MVCNEEIRRGWPSIVIAAFGSAVGISGLLLYTIGLFTADLEHAIGLSKTSYGLGLLVVSAGVAAGTVCTGRAIDRFGTRRVIVFGQLSFACGYLALATIVDTVPAFLAVMFALGFLASASGPVGFTRTVSLWFVKSRGFALGLAMTGIGVAAAVVPLVVNSVIAEHGWRAGFLVLAAIAASGIAPVLAFLKEPSATASGGQDGHPTERVELDVPAPARARASFAAIRRDWTFWRLLSTFFMMSFAFVGLLTHFVPMLRTMDVEPSQAATLASLIGFAVIGSRIVVGFLLDRFRPGLVAAGVCASSALGTGFLIVGGAAFAPLAAIALGLAIGGEIDMIGFFTARYFALAGYARAYSWMYTGFVIAAGVSPLLIGILFDALGAYSAALILCGALATICAFAFATLPAPPPRTSPAYALPRPAETALQMKSKTHCGSRRIV